MYVQRTLEPYVEEASRHFPVLLVVGPRQVGKTTFLQNLSEGKRTYVTLDDPTLRALAQEEPKLFLERFPTPILIDEIQYAPALLPFIKMAVDREKKPGAYWLTGSQQFHLMKGVSESLAGRVAIVNLQGLSQFERIGAATAHRPFLPIADQLKQPLLAVDRKKMPEVLPTEKIDKFKGLLSNVVSSFEKASQFNAGDDKEKWKSLVGGMLPSLTEASGYYHLNSIFEQIWRGGFPAIALDATMDRDLFYSSYVQTYLQRDVHDLTRVGSELSFLKFLRAAAARTGQFLNLAELARDCDISPPTAKSWLSILEASGIVYLLEPYATNLSKRLVKAPKLYFLDTGLCAYLTGWSDATTLEAGAMSGAILETFVVAEILKSWWHNGKQAPLFCYRDKDKNEIDLLIVTDQKAYPVEIKKTGSPHKKAIRSFSVLEKIKIPTGEGGLICFVDRILPIDQKNIAIPISYV